MIRIYYLKIGTLNFHQPSLFLTLPPSQISKTDTFQTRFFFLNIDINISGFASFRVIPVILLGKKIFCLFFEQMCKFRHSKNIKQMYSRTENYYFCMYGV